MCALAKDGLVRLKCFVHKVLAVNELESAEERYRLHPFFLQGLQTLHRDSRSAFGNRRSIKAVDHLDMTVTCLPVLRLKTLQNIAHTQTVSADLIGVCRTDALAGRTDLRLPFCRFVGLIQKAVCRQNQMRFLGNEQVFLHVVSRRR